MLIQYVEMAVYGDNFWISGQKTHYLRIRNFSRVDMVKSTLGFVRIIGMVYLIVIYLKDVYFCLGCIDGVLDTLCKLNKSKYFD